MEFIPKYDCSDPRGANYHTHAKLIEQMIANHVDPNACLEWPFRRVKGKDRLPYGRVVHRGKDWRVHRLAWRIAYGEIPDDICVLHRCDNPPCFNPSHLFLGDRIDNNADMFAKGRSRPPIHPWSGPRGPRPDIAGERNSQSKLTAEKVRQIKKYLALGCSQQTLANDFKVHQTLISAINNGRAWKHVTD